MPEDSSNSWLYATFRLADRETLARLTNLPDSDSAVSLVGLYDSEAADSDPIMIDLSGLTDKQWEALDHAAKLGHYSGTRGGNLSTIAEKLDITESAASQRLRAAESKIISQILATHDIDGTSN